MTTLADLPLRQKVLLSVTVLTGLFIIFAYHTRMISWEALNLIIFFYAAGVPAMLLANDTLIDLNRNEIYILWAIVGCLFLVAYFLTHNNPTLTIRRSPDFVDRGINKLIAHGSTRGLKALPIFLLCYWPLNYLVKKKTGNYLINTFKKMTYSHDLAKREIDWYDIYINIFLLFVIIAGSLFDL